MESEAIADADGKGSAKDADKETGRATLEGAPAEQDLPGRARTVSQAGASGDGVVRPGEVSKASYPEKEVMRSYQGPAISDFLNSKKKAAAASAESTASGGSATPRSLSPAARAAALPDISKEAEGFTNFLQDSPDRAAKDSPPAAAMASGAPGEPVEDFTAWAAQEQQKWSQPIKEMSASNSAADIPAPRSASAAPKAAADRIAAFDDSEVDTEQLAEPLIKRQAPAPASSGFEPDFAAAEKPVASKQSNPFDDSNNPFATATPNPEPAPTNKAASKKPAVKSTARKTLDGSFQMDSGWKPANLERP